MTWPHVSCVAMSMYCAAALATADPLTQPTYNSFEQAVAESNGYWLWAEDNRAVRNPETGLVCADTYAGFHIMALSQRDAARSGEASCSYFNENQNEILALSTKPATDALDTPDGLLTLRCDGSPRFTPLYEILGACTRAGRARA